MPREILKLRLHGSGTQAPGGWAAAWTERGCPWVRQQRTAVRGNHPERSTETGEQHAGLAQCLAGRSQAQQTLVHSFPSFRHQTGISVRETFPESLGLTSVAPFLSAFLAPSSSFIHVDGTPSFPRSTGGPTQVPPQTRLRVRRPLPPLGRGDAERPGILPRDTAAGRGSPENCRTRSAPWPCSPVNAGSRPLLNTALGSGYKHFRVRGQQGPLTLPLPAQPHSGLGSLWTLC